MSMSAVTDLHGSDAAGNGLAAAYGVLASIAMWIAIAITLMGSAAMGNWPAWAPWAALVLVPACAVADFVAIDLLEDKFYTSQWPLIVPAAAPVLLLAFAIWNSSSALRAVIPARTAAPAVWGAILILSAIPWPVHFYRSSHRDADMAAAEAAYKAAEPARREAARQANLAAFNQLGKNAPLEEWLDFISPENELREQAFAKIRQLPRRQKEAEGLFRMGYTYLERDLPEMDLQATPPICKGSFQFFREKIDDFTPRVTDPMPITKMQEFILPYMPGLEWMAKHNCDCGPVLDELEKVTREYQDSPERSKLLAEIASMRTVTGGPPSAHPPP